MRARPTECLLQYHTTMIQSHCRRAYRTQHYGDSNGRRSTRRGIGKRNSEAADAAAAPALAAKRAR